MARRLTPLLIGLALIACQRAPKAAVDAEAPDSSTPLLIDWAEIEAGRQTTSVPASALHETSTQTRRAAVRAVARIGDKESLPILLESLHDSDTEVVAFAAHGLGAHCRSNGGLVTGALVTRLATMKGDVAAILRALGKCDSVEAENTLAQQLTTQCRPAAFALGDIGNRKSKLADGTHAALAASPCATGAALYPYSRMNGGASMPAVKALSTRALATPSDDRIWAIRALGKAGEVAPFGNIVTSSSYTLNERIDAAKFLAEHAPSRADEAVAQLAPKMSAETFHILTTLVTGIAHKPSRAAALALFAMTAQAKREAAGSITTTHRWNRLACESARVLAQGDHNAAVLNQCAPKTSLAWERARLATLLSKPVRTKFIPDFQALGRSTHLPIREDALEALATHHELSEVAGGLLAEAIASPHVGLVATAATVVHRKPSLVLRADGKVTPPIEAALNTAFNRPWPGDATETATALFDAAKDLGIVPSPSFTNRWACHPAEAVRAHVPQKDVDCPKPSYATRKPTKSRYRIRSTAGDLSIALDPQRAPLAAQRFEELVARNFFDGTKVHRLVPGFVAQFGDPQSKDNDGDGYGGSGTSLPCETSPVAFEPLHVGVAIAGKDTGSSQFFVTLARTPHLDGAYSWIGQASGPWHEVVEGDVIESVIAEQ